MVAENIKKVSGLSLFYFSYDTFFAAVKLSEKFAYLNADSHRVSAFLYIFADDF